MRNQITAHFDLCFANIYQLLDMQPTFKKYHLHLSVPLLVGTAVSFALRFRTAQSMNGGEWDCWGAIINDSELCLSSSSSLYRNAYTKLKKSLPIGSVWTLCFAGESLRKYEILTV